MNKFDYRAALINLLKSILITKCGAGSDVKLKLLEVRYTSYLQIDNGYPGIYLLNLDFFNDAEDNEIISLLDDFIKYFKGEFDHEQK